MIGPDQITRRQFLKYTPAALLSLIFPPAFREPRPRQQIKFSPPVVAPDGTYFVEYHSTVSTASSNPQSTRESAYVSYLPPDAATHRLAFQIMRVTDTSISGLSAHPQGGVVYATDTGIYRLRKDLPYPEYFASADGRRYTNIAISHKNNIAGIANGNLYVNNKEYYKGPEVLTDRPVWSPDGQNLVFVTASGLRDMRFNLATHTHILDIDSPSDQITISAGYASPRFSPDSNTVTATSRHAVAIFNANDTSGTAREIIDYEDTFVNGPALYSPDGRYLLFPVTIPGNIGEQQYKAAIHNLTTGKTLALGANIGNCDWVEGDVLTLSTVEGNSAINVYSNPFIPESQ